MGPSARAAAFGSALTLAACAMIAGLDDPETVSDATSAEGGSSSSSGSVQDTGNASSSGGGSSSGVAPGDSSSDGASSSGAADAQPDAPQCALAKIGDNCTQPSQCCSNKCNERKLCANACKPQGMFNCIPASTDECCVGLWCNAGSCSGCIDSGQPAAENLGVRLAQSCCSRSLQGGFGPNCQ